MFLYEDYIGQPPRIFGFFYEARAQEPVHLLLYCTLSVRSLAPGLLFYRAGVRRDVQVVQRDFRVDSD